MNIDEKQQACAMNDLKAVKRMVEDIHKLHFTPISQTSSDDIKAKLKASILTGVRPRQR